jgi:hypothetical protein
MFDTKLIAAPTPFFKEGGVFESPDNISKTAL